MTYKLHNIFYYLCSIVFYFLVVMAAPKFAMAATNLVPNPSLESAILSSSTPDHWHVGGFGTNSAVFSYPVQGPNGAGDSAAQVSITTYTSGDAKWYFDSVPVQSLAGYTFSDTYNSNAPSVVEAQFTLADNSLMFARLATLPSTGGTWATTTQVFTVPMNTVSMTIFHLMQSVGQLAVDDYSLVLTQSASQNVFSEGMVSLTFDDGWTSQYDNALPILNAAGFDGTFYIISNAMRQASNLDNLLNDPNATPVVITSATSTTWQIYPDPSQHVYHFSDTYQSSGTSTISAIFRLADGSTTTTVLALLPPAANPQAITLTFTEPDNIATSSAILNTFGPPLWLVHSWTKGMLTITNPSLIEGNVYMTQQQVLAVQAAGHEIGAHTMDHCDLVQLQKNPALALTTACASPLTASTTSQTEINGSRTALQAAGISPVDDFAYPYGSYNAAVQGFVAAGGFAGARSVELGYNTKTTDKFALKNQIIDLSLTSSPTAFTTVKSWIDTAVQNKVWLILTLHQIEPMNTIIANNDTDATTPEFLQQIVSYLHDQQVPVKTVHDALAIASTPSTPPLVPQPPVANPPAGTYAAGQSVALSSVNSTSVRFTINGTIPTCSTGSLYVNPIVVSTTTDVKAIGCNSTASSTVSDFPYIITPSFPPPTTNIVMVNGYPTVNGNYINCNGVIDNDMAHHTTNPTDTDPGHHIGQNCPVGTLVYNFLNSNPNPPPPVTPGVPVANPLAGTYQSALNVSLTSASSTTIHYTVDGSAPTCSSGIIYVNSIVIETSTDVKAIGCTANGSSSVVDFAYVITPTPPPASVCPAAASNVFTGCYYTDQKFTTLGLTRTDSSVNFDWGGGSPNPSIPADHFSARWQGMFNFNAGTYIFTVTGDDGLRLAVDGRVIIDKMIDQAATTYNVSQALSAGSHLVSLEYYENMGNAVAKLSWVQSPINPPPGNQTITVIQPVNNSSVSGLVEVQANISGLNSNTYNLGWRTDPNGSFVGMFNDPTGTFKRNYIDFTNWTWNANNQYRLEFQATDLNNNVIGNIVITVNH